ncbi:MAG: hypothetical protein A2W91_16355 [Bacteroidetes bacterium GWF2_38_335]|nr:MAG: hypothetical protein A2W91_16355 [Bacteroidetes bacterium GWF2_38_335]OFY81261.1 MAG: hypothetical protein A2281_07330 [Bacteroidetes bacterium RIFOXYA12_FULL_38_20]HBS85379.1 hypothetical protein [Bacteroidales bacterium]
MKKQILTLISIVITFYSFSQCETAIYRFNGNTLDELGVHHGTNNGATPAANRFSQVSGAMKFANAYVNCNAPLIPESADWSINMWINPSEFNFATGNSLFGQFETSATPNGRFMVEIDNLIEPNIVVRHNATTAVESVSPIVPNQWQMITIMREGSYLKIYYNGVFDNQALFTGNIIQTENLILGVHDEGYVSVRDFKGKMDEVIVYDCALTDVQILDLYNMPNPCAGFTAETFTLNDATIYGYPDGAAYVQSGGGTPPYTYTWNDASHTANDTVFNLVGATIYNVTVIDANNCFLVTSAMVGQPDPLSIIITSVDNTCGSVTGSAAAAVTGGVPPYTFVWSSGDTLATADSLAAGMYSVQVTDANGAFAHGYVMISDIGAPEISVDSIIHVSCFGANDGAINITVTGGTPPVEIIWWNGATTEDISDLQPGPYEVEVIDDAGCIAMQSITINEPNPIEVLFNVIPAGCGESNGSLQAVVSGGVVPYSFSWSTGATTGTVSGLAAGMYHLTVTDSHGCHRVRHIPLHDTGGPEIQVDSIINASCGVSEGSIYTTVFGGTLPYTGILWSDGSSGSSDLEGVAPGNYSLTVTDSDGCISTIMEEIGVDIPAIQPICVVTVDSFAARNLVVWEKVASEGISHYNIYKETTMADVYQLVDTVPYTGISVYLDYLSSPVVRAWRYKISAVDLCGNESEPSELHKTIHLTVNLGLGSSINLLWDNYEGFEYYTYNIYRYSTSLGFELLSSLPSNLNSFTDNDPPAGIITYAVAVAKPDGECLGTKDVGGPYSQSVSNLEDLNFDSGIDELFVGRTVIYPNPANGLFNLSVSSKDDQITIQVYDMHGRKVSEKKLGTDLENIDLTHLKSGVYTIKIKGKKYYSTQKIVISKD